MVPYGAAREPLVSRQKKSPGHIAPVLKTNVQLRFYSMNDFLRKKAAIVAASSVLVLVSVCGGGSSGGDSSNNGADSANVVSNPIVDNVFVFPEVAAANGALTAIPTGPVPEFSARRTVQAGSGSVVGYGDPVVLSYNMYSWTTGELVESTSSFDEPVTVRAGVADGIPDYLSNSLLGRNIGDKIQIIFEPGMEDLPEYLDPTDAYVVVLDLI